MPNPRIKLTACGTRSHGKKHRLTHAAAYPHRYADTRTGLTLMLRRRMSFHQLYIPGLLLVAFVTACRNQVVVSPSPDGSIVARVAESVGLPTTSIRYEVSVEDTSRHWRERVPIARLYDATRNDQAYGVNLKWESTTVLVVEYLKAREAKLLRDSVTLNHKVVRIELRSGMLDPQAPPGGMDYNLKGRPRGW